MSCSMVYCNVIIRCVLLLSYNTSLLYYKLSFDDPDSQAQIYFYCINFLVLCWSNISYLLNVWFLLVKTSVTLVLLCPGSVRWRRVAVLLVCAVMLVQWRGVVVLVRGDTLLTDGSVTHGNALRRFSTCSLGHLSAAESWLINSHLSSKVYIICKTDGESMYS